jgi:cytochrome c oxidase subunit II
MRKTGVVFVLLLFATIFVADDKKEEPAHSKKIGSPAPVDAAVKEIEVSAKKYEFSPSTIEVPVNTVLKLHLKATDREHGFELKSLKDSCIKFDPNTPGMLEYYADKAGEYEFRCCKRCGLGHGKMKGKLIVK